MPSYGQIYNYESPNQHGGLPYMWKTGGVSLPEGFITESGKQTWEMLDAYTGKSVCKVANVSFGYRFWWFIIGAFGVYGLDGSLCNYNIEDLAPWGATEPDYQLQVWNNTAIPTMLGDAKGTSAWQWRPSGGAFGSSWPDPPTTPEGYYIHDGNTGYSLNVSLSAEDVDGPKNKFENQTGSIRCVREGEYIIVGNDGRNDERGTVQGKMTALSLEPGSEGTKLWETPFTPPYASLTENVSTGIFFGGFSITGVYPEEGVTLFESSKQLKRWGYSLETGEQLWESEPEPQMNFYYLISNYYDGKLHLWLWRSNTRL
jgi:hypothetical protein